VTFFGLLKAQPVLVGLALGAVFALGVALFLPRHEKRRARGPIILLAIYALARWAMELFPDVNIAAKFLHFVAVFAWCTAIVRTGFVLFTSSRLSRLVGRPWPKIMRDVVQAFLYFGIALIALRAVGVEPGSLLTTSALLTAVLGLSMQETLGNLFAGLAMQGQQTLEVGDWVRFADGLEGMGEVVEINWRATHFLTNNRVQVIVPNGVIARSILKNYSRPTRVVRQDSEIVLPHDISPERARSIILGAVRGADGVLPEPEPFVVVSSFVDRGITYSLRYFIDNYGRRDPIDGGVRQRILYSLHRAGIALPVPGRRIELVNWQPSTLRPNETVAPPSEKAQGGLGASLARFDLFKGFDPRALDHLAERTTPALYSPGEAIIRQGESGNELFALERGRVEVLVAPEGRPPLRVAVLEAGALFGEAALMTGERRSATVVALTECEVIAVSRSAFQELIEAHPDLSERLTGMLATRMDELSQAVSDVAQPNENGDRRSDLLIQRIRAFFSK
jgi:small-conductance mechanosensitive channel/CRP-like cAMP-binding protein